jgi:BMFP domain-containing protein YqiC
MQKDSKLFDDFSKLASGAFGTLADMKREIEAIVMDKSEKIMARMQLVKKEEFEVMRLMVEQTRLEQEKIVNKLAQLEKLLESHDTKKKTTSNTSKK